MPPASGQIHALIIFTVGYHWAVLKYCRPCSKLGESCISILRIFVLSTLTMIAFASNSILVRMALVSEAIDPISFTAIRLISGAILLSIIVKAGGHAFIPLEKASIRRALPLFIYAIAFSLAYVELDTGTGALLLFAAVQFSMLALATLKGERHNRLEWVGIIIAFSGLIYLLAPAVSAPPLAAATLMISAGVAWGFYSVYGKETSTPVRTSAQNFQLAALAGAVMLVLYPPTIITPNGWMLATVSGAVTSGIGYVIWYKVLPQLRVSIASSIQLSVPLIAAAGGVLFVGDLLSLRLAIAGTIILGGIFLTIMAAQRTP
jgi:drug/metabolite transporter (DMT)-like permease